MKTKIAILAAFLLMLSSNNAFAQDVLPRDNVDPAYFPSPYYRESESHPVRTIAYVLHPIGWTLRELVYRPISAVIASNPATRSVFGYRDPFDFKETICFNPHTDAPDCAMVPPYSKISHSVNIIGGGSKSNYSMSGRTQAAAYGGGYGQELNEESMKQLGATRQVYFPDIAFESGKTKLSALGEGRVRQVAMLLQSDPDLNVVLEGNTDKRGSDKANMQLGAQRAQAVRNELVSLGISPARLDTVSHGSSSPVFTENAEWAHAVNRRVVVSVGYGRDTVGVGSVDKAPQVQAEAVAPAPAAVETDSAVNNEVDDILPPAAMLE